MLRALFALLLAIALLGATPLLAERLEATDTAAPPIEVDGVTRTMPGIVDGMNFPNGFFRSITFDGTEPNFGTGEILDVDVTVEFRKAQDPPPNDIFGPGFDEIGFALRSPAGSVVELIPFGTFDEPAFQQGQTLVFDGAITLDDEAGSALPSDIAAGTFQPFGLLSDFDGENALGEWRLFIEDNLGGQPLEYESFSLSIETMVPEPASVALGGICLAALLVVFAWRQRVLRRA